MPPIVAVAAIMVASSLAAAGWLILAPRDRSREKVLANIAKSFAATDTDRQYLPTDKLATRLARRAAPRRTVARIDHLMALAGRPAAWSLDRILLGKLLLPTAAIGLGMLYIGAGPTPSRYALVGVVTVVCYFVPDLLLQSRGSERQVKMSLELPDTLDQMTIAMEAGSGFESSMLRAAQNGKGPLAAELIRTLQDMQLGQSRKDAYLALSERTNVADLRRFLRAVIQADLYGIAIADVLRIQASEMRVKRRQRAEEKAMKIPVKVIFPLILCILPALFIVLLGPVVLQVLETFGR